MTSILKKKRKEVNHKYNHYNSHFQPIYETEI